MASSSLMCMKKIVHDHDVLRSQLDAEAVIADISHNPLHTRGDRVFDREFGLGYVEQLRP